MAELTVEITYGKALYEAARDMNKVDQILDELKSIEEILRQEPDFGEFFTTPVISGPEKKNVIKNIFAGRISDEALNFLMILIDKRRTASFGRILKEYRKLVDHNLGISLGTILSVEPLTDIQMKSFEEKTGILLKRNIKLENKIEPSIMGGVKIFIEGKVIDASIRKQLQDLEGRIKQI
jgi:F-type H+-transporting ATPase subunit delta